ncbi:MAG: hypothetical protein Q7S86_05385 [bacterium]|nr:hypothetical protein [bacterium]
MSELIIVAGPQASGKSTTIDMLNRQFRTMSPLLPVRKRPIIFPLQESRQIVIHKHMLLGGIFMTKEHEQEVVECDIIRMNLILKRNCKRIVYMDECNIFTIAHARVNGATHPEAYWGTYMALLEKLQTKVIFLDVPPDVSWERRRRKYEERLIYFPKKRHAEITKQYRTQLYRMYPMLKELYRRIPFPKEIIDACAPSEFVLQQASGALARLSTAFR